MVVVLGVIAAVLLLRRSHDDVHSVEHYHRQLHTLEEMPRRTPIGRQPARRDGRSTRQPGRPSRPARSASRAPRRCASPRRTRPPVPPVPPPPVANPSKPLTFDDASPDPVPATFMTGNEDRVIRSINHRPRRLGGPAAAVGAVLVLVLVLILTGLHSNTTKHHGKAGQRRHDRRPPGDHAPPRDDDDDDTSTTAPPSVSAPTAATAHTATYTVADADLLADDRRHDGGVLGGGHQHRDGRGALHDDAAVRPVPRHRRQRTGDRDRRRARPRSRPPSTARP